MTDLSVHFQMMPKPRFRYDVMTLFSERQMVRSPMTVPLPHFGSGGDLPLVITKKHIIFLIILKGENVGELKTKIILKSFRKSIIPKV